MEEEDCLILEVTEEVIEKRKVYSQNNQSNDYRVIGSIKDTICSHHFGACSYQCTESPAVGAMTLYCGLKEGGKIDCDKFFNLPYCENHLKYHIRSSKSRNEETMFHLLACALCQRKELTICSNCALVFQVPNFTDCYYCPLCKHL